MTTPWMEGVNLEVDSLTYGLGYSEANALGNDGEVSSVEVR